METTIDEYVENKIAGHIDSLNKGDIDISDHIECENAKCDGHYVGLYHEADNYPGFKAGYIMQCYKCRDEIEI